ncbi:MAG: hypothetical protein JRI80_01880 [Deltaproteobacteria bacterium]|nr:hypothetical protein [Deltaproteobacteria bacterium]
MTFKKKILFWVLALGASYFLLSYHIIFFGKQPRLLKKSHLTLNYTFFSVQSKPNQKIMAIDDLREDGIADLLVEEGKMKEEERDLYLEQYEETEDDR